MLSQNCGVYHHRGSGFVKMVWHCHILEQQADDMVRPYDILL